MVRPEKDKKPFSLINLVNQCVFAKSNAYNKLWLTLALNFIEIYVMSYAWVVNMKARLFGYKQPSSFQRIFVFPERSFSIM